jgi:type II secretory pathway component PulF
LYHDAIKTVANEVEKGGSIGASISRYPYFPPIVGQMMSVGEETGKLDEILMKVSKHFEMESEFAIKGLTSAIEPLMIVLLGAGVGFLVVSVIMPIYKLTSSI